MRLCSPARASSALSRLTPYLTPYGAVSPGFRRTNSLFGRPTLNTGRPCTGSAERTGDELENRRAATGPPATRSIIVTLHFWRMNPPQVSGFGRKCEADCAVARTRDL
jgi:hypothetical protein